MAVSTHRVGVYPVGEVVMSDRFRSVYSTLNQLSVTYKLHYEYSLISENIAGGQNTENVEKGWGGGGADHLCP